VAIHILTFLPQPSQFETARGSLIRLTAMLSRWTGALEMVQMRVECTLTKDALWGDEVTELRIVLKEIMDEAYHDDDE